MAATLLGTYASTSGGLTQTVTLTTPSTPGKSLIIIWKSNGDAELAFPTGENGGWVSTEIVGGGPGQVLVSQLVPTSHTASLNSIDFEFSIAGELVAAVFEDDEQFQWYNGGAQSVDTDYTTTSWNIGDHTLTRDTALAVYVAVRNDGNAISDFAQSFDQGFTELADTGSSSGSVGLRMWVASADSIDLSAETVTMTTTDSSEINLAIGGILCYNTTRNAPDAVINRQLWKIDGAAAEASTSKSMPLDFTPTPGNLLVAVGEASATFSTPTGWTRAEEFLGTYATVVFTKVSDGTEASIDWTQNGARSAVMQVWELPAGSSLDAYIGDTPGWNIISDPVSENTGTIGPYSGRKVWLQASTTGFGFPELISAGDQTFAPAWARGAGWEDAGLAASDVTIPDGETAEILWSGVSGGNVNIVRMIFDAPEAPPFSPLDIAWESGFWADQPGWTPPADGADLVADPADFVGGADWVRTGGIQPQWVDDVDGSGKPGLRFPSDLGGTYSRLEKTPMLGSATDLTAVVIGRVYGANGDLIDGSGRRLLDVGVGGTTWRMHAGSSVVTSPADTADNGVHLYIARYQSSGNETLEVDNVQVIDGEAGSNTTGSLFIGSSGNTEHAGSEIAFAGFISTPLTAQQKADLWQWYQDTYQPVPVPANFTARGSANGEVDLSWDAVPDAVGYRLYIDGVEDSGVGLIAGTSYTKTGLVAGQMYDFQVLAENASAEQSLLTPIRQERAARVYSSIPADGYRGFGHTPLVTTPEWENGEVIAFNEWSSFNWNGRSEGSQFHWYEADTTTPVYGYAYEWLDGATVSLRSGSIARIIEWHRGDDAWRETDLTTFGQSHTIDYSDTTTNTGAGSVTGPFDSSLIEYAAVSDPPFEVWIWSNEEPAEPPAPPAPTKNVTWRTFEYDAAAREIYTFPNIDIGTDQNVAGIIFGRDTVGQAIEGTVRVNGSDITPIFTYNQQDTSNWNILIGFVATGVTGPIEIEFDTTTGGTTTNLLRCSVAVWSIDDDPGFVTGGGALMTENGVQVDDLGALMTIGYIDGTGGYTLYSDKPAHALTERSDVDMEATNRIVVADNLDATGQVTIEMTKRPHSLWESFGYLTFDNRMGAPDSIAVENAKTGDAGSIEPLGTGNGDVGFLGYSKQFSVNAGEVIDFAVDGVGATDIDIYRIGYYGGVGKRLVTSLSNTPTDQPAGSVVPGSNGGTEMAWNTTASWAIPANTTTGLFVAVVTDGANPRAWIPFIVRNDSVDADIVVKLSDSTWAGAYNYFGDVGSEKTGKSVYGSGGPLGAITDRSHYISYDRPIVTRPPTPGGNVVNHWDAQELALIDWLEDNGYNVKYISSYDLDQQHVNDVLGTASVFMSVGHDEYWSQGMRDNIETWRDAGGNVIFMAGNHVFWRIRWDNGGRGFWCYKDTMAGPGGHIAGDPLDPVSWTGTWKDLRRPAPGPEHEYTTTGDNFRMNGILNLTMTVSAAAYGSSPFWRDTTVQSGPTDLVVNEVIGFEANQYMPPDSGAVRLAQTTHNIDGSVAGPNGENYSGNGDIDWSPVMFYATATSGVTVGFGTTQWQWGLSNRHERGSAVANVQMRQATANLLADLGAPAVTLQGDLVAPTPVALSTYGVTYTGVDPNMGGDGSIWQPSVPPGQTVWTAGDNPDYLLATRFTVSDAGFITTLWYYKADPVDHGAIDIFLTNFTTESVLAQTTLDVGTQTGWVSATLSSAVPVANDGTIYGAVVRIPAGQPYTYVPSSPATVNGSLSALSGGSYKETATVSADAFVPFTASYLVDVSFVMTLPDVKKFKLGSGDPDAIYVGSTKVTRIYKGDTVVYEDST